MVGQPITLTAAVNGATGAVAFYDGTTCLDPSVPLNSGIATLTIPSGLSVAGSHALTAQYSGNYPSSTSPPSEVLVLDTSLPNFVQNNSQTVANDPVDQATPSPLTDGSLVLPLADAGLNYISGSVNPDPIISADCDLTAYDPGNSSSPLTAVTASWTVYRQDGTTVYAITNVSYGPDDLTGNLGNGSYRFAIQVNAASLPTGQYPWQLTVTETYSDGNSEPVSPVSPPADGCVINVLNRSASQKANSFCPLAPGWALTGFDYLTDISGSSVTLVQGDGTMGLFTFNGSSFTSPAGPLAFTTLASARSGYTLTGSDGVMESFDGTGRLISVTEASGNVTQYSYYPPGPFTGLLEEITIPGDQTTDFAYYSNGVLHTITDFASSTDPGRTATLRYNGAGQLASVTDPNPGVSGENSAGDRLRLYCRGLIDHDVGRRRKPNQLQF